MRPDPLLDCLVEICRLHGHSATRASLSAGLPLTDGKLPLDMAERAAARAGMYTRLERQTPDGVDAATLPALLILKQNKACVLLGWDGEQARVLLPETGQGQVLLSRADLAERSAGLVLHVRPHFRFDDRTPAVRPPREGHWFWGALLSQRLHARTLER